MSPLPGRKKNPEAPPQLGGPPAIRRAEPADHALGRSQGGFGTKTHLVCDRHGIILAVTVTPGQRQESQAVPETFERAQRPRRAGRPRWPNQAAADKGYRYPGVRAWIARRHMDPVIPTR
jgi:transposase